MKLAPANLTQKLQTIKPIQKLSNRLKQTAGKSGVSKRSIRQSESEVAVGKKATDKRAADKKAIDKKAIDGKAVSEKTISEKTANKKTIGQKTAEENAKPSETLDGQSPSHEPRSHLSNKSALSNTRAMPSFVRNSKFVQNSKSARVAYHLLLVKPWVLVVGLWLVSALSAVVAIEGLISPKKLTEDLPEPAAEVAPVAKSDSFIDVEQSDEGITAEGLDGSKSEPSVSEAAPDSGMPVWPVVTLVGSCAAGCVVLSRRRAMLRAAARRKLLAAKAKNSPIRLNASNGKAARKAGGQSNKKASIAAFKSAARSVSQSEKLAASTARDRKRRQRKRPSTQPLAHSSSNNQSSNKKRVLVSRSTAQQAAPQSRVSQPVKPQRNRQKVARLVRRQPVVSVVPANQSHRLDWVEGSLAHDMDRRVAMREAASSQERAAM